MGPLATLAQSLALSYASGVSVYATVALVGLLDRGGYVGQLPGGLGMLSSWPVIGLAVVLFSFEFLATLVPGVASAWETFHSLIRPPAAAALAVLTTWHGDPLLVVVAALLGGGLALGTHVTKLGLRYAIDASPEPVTNGAANVAEFSVVAGIAYFAWSHPYTTLGAALALLLLLAFTVRMIWRSLGRVLAGDWRPRHAFEQEARCTGIQRPSPEPEIDD